MKIRHLYLILAALGLVLPYSQFLPWLALHGFDLSLFIHDLFANRISGFFGLDVLVSAMVVIVLVSSERRRLGERAFWLPIIALATVGVSLGLPLFLYFRQVHLEEIQT